MQLQADFQLEYENCFTLHSLLDIDEMQSSLKRDGKQATKSFVQTATSPVLSPNYFESVYTMHHGYILV
jgi:ABC-type uncharacterized transport system substrate-binding protein